MAIFKKILVLPVVVVLAGCTSLTPDLTLSEQLDLLEKDLKALYTPAVVEQPITFHGAMARTIKNNLDNRIKQLETVVAQRKVTIDSLEALPKFNANADYYSRSNFRASSSRSVATGLTSLEPSYGTETDVRTVRLEASWNLINSGLSVVNAKQSSDRAKIAQERQRKMVHSLVREVHTLYWQAASEQLLRDEFERLFKEGRGILAKLKTAEQSGLMPRDEVLKQQAKLYKSLNALTDAKEKLLSAKIELAYLMNLSPNADFKLDVAEKDFRDKEPQISSSLDDLTMLSLVMRPESREEVLNKRLAERKPVEEILKTVPGFEIIGAQNYDSNGFLVNNTWSDLSLGLTQNLLKVFTLPTRLDRAETEERLADLKRQTLTAAIMAQTHMAYRSFKHSEQKYDLRRSLFEVEQQITRDAKNKYNANTLSEVEYFEIRSDFVLSRINLHNSFINLWSNYAMLVDTLGLDPVSEVKTDMDITDLETVLKDRYASMDKVVIPDALAVIRQALDGEEKEIPVPTRKPTKKSS